MSSIFLIAFLTSLLKLYFQQARPYWLVNEISGFSCGNDFGSPSGHSSMSMFVTILVIMDLLSTYSLDSVIISTVLCIGGAILVPLPVGFQRLFSGAHAIN
jgi:membrane-associated phospholipid phosphatase